MKIPEQAVKEAAKSMADSIGHGMREKCIDHARAAITAASPYLSAPAREQALEEAAQIVEGADTAINSKYIKGFGDLSPAVVEAMAERDFDIAAAIRALKSQQNTETSAIEKKKFYHNEWPHDALMAARRDGFIDHNGGEAWRYQFTHKDEKGKYDLLYRDTSNSSIQAALPPVQTGGGE